MMLVVGGAASGKRTFVRGLGYDDATAAGSRRGDLDGEAVLWDLHEVLRDPRYDDVAELEALVRQLASKDVVVCEEVGGGLVPADPALGSWRERVGRACCLLAPLSDRVVRMVCGIPVDMKPHKG